MEFWSFSWVVGHSLIVRYHALVLIGKSLKKNPMTPKSGKTPKTNEDGGVIKKKSKKKKKRLPKVFIFLPYEQWTWYSQPLILLQLGYDSRILENVINRGGGAIAMTMDLATTADKKKQLRLNFGLDTLSCHIRHLLFFNIYFYIIYTFLVQIEVKVLFIMLFYIFMIMILHKVYIILELWPRSYTWSWKMVT